MKKLEGLYLVVSPILSAEDLLFATEKALDGGVDVLQFSIGKETVDAHSLASALAGLAKKHKTPFLINNDLVLTKEVGADGVHFSTFDFTPSEARKVLGNDAIVGYTVSIDMEKLKWAQQAGADYVSFCSIFNTCEAEQCPIVSLETVKTARSVTNLPIFAAGGINLENLHLILETGVAGVAVTSAILKSNDPKHAARAFKETLKKYGISSN
jgi:thiamine-phosphate pyrophosphorylase